MMASPGGLLIREGRNSDGIPKYVQLGKILRRMIAAQEYRPGEQIPTEAALCRAYGVSRITVREAINTLAQEGLLQRRQGRGTFVARQKLRRNIARLYSFSSDMRELGIAPRSRMLALRREEADARAAERLCLPESNRFVTRIRRVRIANDIPVLLEDTLVPDHLCPGLADRELVNGSLYRYLTEDCHLVLHHAEETYESVILSRADAQVLGCGSTRPVPAFALQRIAFLADGSPIELTRSVGRGDMLTLAVTMFADTADFKRVISGNA
jgi:GntR family transcriptional regulator